LPPYPETIMSLLLQPVRVECQAHPVKILAQQLLGFANACVALDYKNLILRCGHAVRQCFAQPCTRVLKGFPRRALSDLSALSAFHGKLMKEIGFVVALMTVRAAVAPLWLPAVEPGIFEQRIRTVVRSGREALPVPGSTTFEMTKVGNQYPALMMADMCRSSDELPHQTAPGFQLVLLLLPKSSEGLLGPPLLRPVTDWGGSVG